MIVLWESHPDAGSLPMQPSGPNGHRLRSGPTNVSEHEPGAIGSHPQRAPPG